ncbi:MAG: hypothetical protein HC905_01360 [Bacteroidales bacterium]|nr:hypothetical protein [Bacteroidales bacterium]
MEIAPFPVFISSLSNNKFLYLNKAALSFLKVSEDAAYQLNPEMLYLNHDDRNNFREKLEKMVR